MYKAEEASQAPVPPPMRSLLDLPECAYVDVATGLDCRSLCNLDSACCSLRDLSTGPQGPWRARGDARFKGIELETECRFMIGFHSVASCARDTDWKARYLLFARGLPTFRAPYTGRVITHIDEPDEVVYCRCIVTCVQQSADIDFRIYLEFAIISNADSCSVSLVDFRSGGHSSITFSPDTGEVIWESKVQDTPRKVEGAYVQPLSSGPADRADFEGSVGLYINGGHVAFFRRWEGQGAGQPSMWQTTGYISNLCWAEGACVTPCLAFRDAGNYHVRIVRLGHTPPVDPGDVPSSYDESRWTSLEWEQPAVADESYSFCSIS